MPVKTRPPNRARRSIPKLLPAPVGGLNGRDSIAAMPIQDAFLMENWFPKNTHVEIRGGTENYVTGFSHPVESLEVYTGAAGSKMLAFSDGNIYDVTAGGLPGVPLAGGRNSNRVTTAMFSNAGSQWLLIYSGQDQPLGYNGVAITPLVITGMTGSQNTLYGPHVFKGRVFLAQFQELGFYYLDIGAIQGAATFFDLSQISLKGGSLAAITSFSQQDTGVGPQDYALFVTTEGEYILYAGTDPADPDNWALVGRYVGPAPIGTGSHFRFRGDVYFVTKEGILSFAQIRQGGESAETDDYITAKLGVHYDRLTQYISTHGWKGMIYPGGGMLIVNIPLTGAISGEYRQFAMNTDTNCWGAFKDIKSICWTLFNRRPYYGTYDGRIVLFDEGTTDNGAEVFATARQAWNPFDAEQGVGTMDKQFHFVSIALKADGEPNVACNINVDFEDDQPPQVGFITPNPGAIWNLATWNVDYWAGSAVIHNVLIPIGKIGYVASIWLQAGSFASKVHWLASRVLYEPTKRNFL